MPGRKECGLSGRLVLLKPLFVQFAKLVHPDLLFSQGGDGKEHMMTRTLAMQQNRQILQIANGLMEHYEHHCRHGGRSEPRENSSVNTVPTIGSIIAELQSSKESGGNSPSESSRKLHRTFYTIHHGSILERRFDIPQKGRADSIYNSANSEHTVSLHLLAQLFQSAGIDTGDLTMQAGGHDHGDHNGRADGSFSALLRRQASILSGGRCPGRAFAGNSKSTMMPAIYSGSDVSDSQLRAAKEYIYSSWDRTCRANGMDSRWSVIVMPGDCSNESESGHGLHVIRTAALAICWIRAKA